MTRNNGPYDFEFPLIPDAVCNRCGADVRNRDVHDDWHEQLLTKSDMADAFAHVARSGCTP